MRQRAPVSKDETHNEKSTPLSLSFQQGVRGYGRTHAQVLYPRSVDGLAAGNLLSGVPLQHPADTLGGRIGVAALQRCHIRHGGFTHLSGSTLSSLTKWSPLVSLKAMTSYSSAAFQLRYILGELTQKVPPLSIQIFTLSVTATGMMATLMAYKVGSEAVASYSCSSFDGYSCTCANGPSVTSNQRQRRKPSFFLRIPDAGTRLLSAKSELWVRLPR